MISYIKNNKETTLFPFLAVFSFFTWIFKIPEEINFIIYFLIVVFLFIKKFSNVNLIMFSIFALMGNFKAGKVFGIEKLNNYQLLYQGIFLIIILLLSYRTIKEKEKLKGILIKPLVGLIGYAVLSLLWTVDFIGGISQIIVIIQGYLAYTFVVTDKEKTTFKEYSWFLTYILIVLGLQYLLLTYNEVVFGNGKGHLYKLWANPNLVASVLGLAFIPSLYKYFTKDNPKWVYLFIIFDVLTIYSIFVSLSQGLYFSFIVGMIALMLIIFIKKRKVLFYVFLSGVVFFVTAMLVLIIFRENFPDFYDKVNKFSTGRIEIYSVALSYLKNPLVLLFGKGVGSTHKLLLENGLNNFYFHSFVFHILVNRGLISLSLTIYSMYLIFKIYQKNKSNFGYFVAITTIIHLSHAIIEINYEYQFLGVLYYMMIAVYEKNERKKINYEEIVNST